MTASRLRTGLLLCVFMVGCQADPRELDPGEDPLAAERIRAIAVAVADWQLAHPSRDPLDWTNGVFYSGVMAARRITGEDRFRSALMDVGETSGWRLGERYRHADDHALAQTYLELFRIERDPRMVAAMRDRADRMMAEPPDWRKEHQLVDFWWCDALFMSPPALALLAEATEDDRYLELMDTLWREAHDLLYDESARLYHRDLRFRAMTNPRFWSRGNAWVLAGLARLLDVLPAAHSTRGFYEAVFQGQAERVLALQGADGLWRSDLLASLSMEPGESSGSALFCFALAWGINEGLLDRAAFEPRVVAAWRALYRNVDLDGRLGWVQKPGAKPDKVSGRGSEAYGSGAFLLAAEQVLALGK